MLQHGAALVLAKDEGLLCLNSGDSQFRNPGTLVFVYGSEAYFFFIKQLTDFVAPLALNLLISAVSLEANMQLGSSEYATYVKTTVHVV